METLNTIAANPTVQSAVIAALSHVVLWVAKKIPAMVTSLPGGYSATKRAVAIKLIAMLGGVEAPKATEAAKSDVTHLNAPL